MWKLRDRVALADLEYGVALLDEDSGDYWSLNPTGAAVVHALLDGKTVATAVEELVREYDVAPDVAQRDVDELVAGLRSAHLLVG